MTFWERNQLKFAPFLFLAPAVCLFLIFVIYPIADSIWVSFHEWSGVNRYAVDEDGNLKNFKWVGLDNYIYLFTNDDEFYVAVFNNIKWFFFSLIAIPFGILLALFLNHGYKLG